MIKKSILNPFIVFPLLTCIFFWPLSSKICTFKNDALTYYYPVRTLISDAINNFELPLWTPYINMGYPLHADMQSGAWNPVIWTMSLISNYSLAGFHFELLFYFALSGIGFYFLAKDYALSKYTAIIAGCCYEFSGPLIDSVQFTACISSACYIPFVFFFFRRLLHLNQQALNSVCTALFLYLLFTGGYPAMFIITVYLLVAFLVFTFFSSSQKKQFLKKLLLPCGLLTGTFTLLSLPAIIAFVNHLQFIDRGTTPGLDFVLENSMPPSCMFSLLSPFSTTATSPLFDTNILMRSIYIGIVPVVFLIYALCKKELRNNKELQFIFFAALVLFGMAWGSHFYLRQFAYYTLPLMNTFRHPALFRLFGVIFFLLAAGLAINEWSNHVNSGHLIKKIILVTGILLTLMALVIIVSQGATLIPPAFKAGEAKNLFYSLSFSQRFLIQLPFIAATLCIFYFLQSKVKGLFYTMCLSIADLFFASQLNMPITVIGAKNFNTIEMLINRNPVKFPVPENTIIEQNVFNSLDSTNAVGSLLPFEKKIGRNDYFITPGNLALQDEFYESPIRKTVFKNRLLYFADSILSANPGRQKEPETASFRIIPPTLKTITAAHFNGDSIAIKKFSANTLECYIETTRPRLLMFLQNNYPGWKAFIDEKEADIMTANITFIGINVPAGKHSIVFRYKPLLIIYAWYISLFTLLCLAFFVGRHVFSNQHNKRNTERKL